MKAKESNLDADYLFFRENLKRTILSQSRYLCPKKRPLPGRNLYSSRPRSPLCTGRHPVLREVSQGSEDEFKSSTSVTTEISSKTGLSKKVVKIIIPPVRPWTDHSSVRRTNTPDSGRSWSNKSPVYVTGKRPSVSQLTQKVTSSSQRMTASTQRMTPSTQRMTSSTQKVFGGSTRETISDYTSGKDNFSSSAGTVTTSITRQSRISRVSSGYDLTTLISGYSLLNSLEKMERRRGEAQIRGVKLVLHRQI